MADMTPTEIKALEAIAIYAEDGKIKDACKRAGISWSNFWRAKNGNAEISQAYEDAKKSLSHTLMQRFETMFDDGDTDPRRVRVRMDGIKWMCGVLNREEFGDKIQHEISGQLDVFAAIAEARARVPGPGCDLQVIDASTTLAISAPSLEQTTDYKAVAPLSEDAERRRQAMFDD